MTDKAELLVSFLDFIQIVSVQLVCIVCICVHPSKTVY